MDFTEALLKQLHNWYGYTQEMHRADLEELLDRATKETGSGLPDEKTTNELISRLTQAVRAADEQFAHSGGSSRHYVRDSLLPQLKEWGLILALDEGWVNPHSRDYFDKDS